MSLQNNTTVGDISASKRPLIGSSDRRKAQNRASQKTYREKRKRQTQELGNRATKAHDRRRWLTTRNDQLTPQYSTTSASETSSDLDCSGHDGVAWTLVCDNVKSESLDPQPDLCPLVTIEKQPTAVPLSVCCLPPDTLLKHSVSRSRDQRQVQVTFSPHSPKVKAGLQDLPPNPLFYLPDCYINHLTILDLTCFAAMRANALVLGLGGDDVCSDYESRFYRPGLAAHPDRLRLTAAITASFSHVTPDLRPSESQLVHSHYTYLDMLPFPRFRDRLLAMPICTPLEPEGRDAENPAGFDEDDLCRDVESGGLVCWGYIGASRLGGSAGGCGGNPWERESWEVQPWFLIKYRFLLGVEGDDDDICRISRGWRESRGDDIEI